ncbi:MAG: hypothetical protein ACRDBO_14585 [Lachnospiraceae bacterium]
MKGILTDKELHSMANAAPVNTHSAREPSYKYTMLCPDVRYRPGGELYGRMVLSRRGLWYWVHKNFRQD